MVAMSTHGRTGLGRALLGSAADKVLRGIHTPLMLYRSADGETD
jgi:nucleotide-binding universal stress UspA family protein